jgi:hypothetical protein
MALFHLAIPPKARRALFDKLRGELAHENAMFQIERGVAWGEMKTREFNRWRQREERLEEIRQRRAQLELAGHALEPIDWERQKVEWKPPEPEKDPPGFGPAVLFRRQLPHMCKCAVDIMTYERAVVLGMPKIQKMRHCQKAQPVIVDLILLQILNQDQIFLEPWGWLPLRRMRLFLRLQLTKALREETARIDADRRSRRQMANDCKQRHSITDRDICGATKTSRSEFYRWLQGRRATRPIGNRSAVSMRLISALVSPIWPPE